MTIIEDSGGPGRRPQGARVTNGKLWTGGADGGGIEVQLADSASIDAFDRLRVSNPTSLFDSILKYDANANLWYESLTATGTAVHSFDQASVLMSVVASGDIAIRQTKEYFRYQPGKSQFAMLTFNLEAAGPTANVTRRVGYFDGENGIFLEQTAAGLGIVRRSSATGAVVDTRIEQADWNLDAMPTLDPTKTQILALDLQWLGVGRVRVGFVNDGILTYAHQFLHANILSTVYMTTAQLPIRYEIEATGLPAALACMRQICSTVASEGGVDTLVGIPHGVASGAPAGSSGTLVPLMSIRPKATIGGEINRIVAVQRNVQVLNSGAGVAEVTLVYDGVLTGAAFASVEADSSMEVDTSATVVTGGHQVQKFYVPGSQGQSSQAQEAGILGRLPLTVDILGANPTNLTIAITNHGTATVAGAMNWQEYV